MRSGKRKSRNDKPVFCITTHDATGNVLSVEGITARELQKAARLNAVKNQDPAAGRILKSFPKVRQHVKDALDLYCQRQDFINLLRETVSEMGPYDGQMFSWNDKQLTVTVPVWSKEVVFRLHILRDLLSDKKYLSRITQRHLPEDFSDPELRRDLSDLRILYGPLHQAWRRAKEAYQKSRDRQGRQFNNWKDTVKAVIEEELNHNPLFENANLHPEDFDELLERLNIKELTIGQRKKYKDRSETSPASELALDHAAFLCNADPYDYSIRQLRTYKSSIKWGRSARLSKSA